MQPSIRKQFKCDVLKSGLEGQQTWPCTDSYCKAVQSFKKRKLKILNKIQHCLIREKSLRDEELAWLCRGNRTSCSTDSWRNYRVWSFRAGKQIRQICSPSLQLLQTVSAKLLRCVYADIGQISLVPRNGEISKLLVQPVDLTITSIFRFLEYSYG
jgi:hypothetical protein